MGEHLSSEITGLLHSRSDVVFAYLFGSRARGGARPDSDVDLGLYLDPPPPRLLGGPMDDIAGELERSLGLTVDLIDLHTAPVDLAHRILRDGQLLAERDRSRRIELEVRTRNEYFDFLPHLLRYRRRGVA